jgi:glutamate--cysteine ligase
VGVRNPGGDYNQLATTLLQIENEFYGTIRPKRTIFSGERPLHALRERGVEYVEVRLMDLDPFVEVGIEASTMRFLDVFLLHCLLSASPPDTLAEIAALGRNQHRTAARGREPGLLLERGESQVSLLDWGAELLQAFEPIAQRLDADLAGTPHAGAHAQALAQARTRLAQPELLPSARVLAVMRAEHADSFIDFGRARSERTHQALLAQPFSESQRQALAAQSQASVQEQQRIEAMDSLPFEQYRQQYTSPDRLGKAQVKLQGDPALSR